MAAAAAAAAAGLPLPANDTLAGVLLMGLPTAMTGATMMGDVGSGCWSPQCSASTSRGVFWGVVAAGMPLSAGVCSALLCLLPLLPRDSLAVPPAGNKDGLKISDSRGSCDMICLDLGCSMHKLEMVHVW